MTAMRVLIADDEALARLRLRNLLADLDEPPTEVVCETCHGPETLEAIDALRPDLVLLDIHMPGIDGVELARRLAARDDPPAVVFVTAHAAHAVTAFELEAADYLTKPVRAERLRQALVKAQRQVAERRLAREEGVHDHLVIQDRGRTERLRVSEVLYLKSELKYLTVRTAGRSYIHDASLAEFEERYPTRFLRVHRNALVARSAVRALVRPEGGEDGDGWTLRLEGIDEPIAVSRRQLPAVRDMLKEPR